jgi:CubicO group peptidase (beta-lactamase class C family)
MSRFSRLLLASSAALALAAPALSETPAGAAAQLDAFLDRFEDLGPGFGVVVVTADEVLLSRVDGVARRSTGAPLTPDTPLYIASQTKAMMGVLAAELDARGVLSLDSTLADHWPNVRWPEGFDASAWTLRHLLSHQVPLDIDRITTIEAYSQRIDPADYPRLIEATAALREPGFVYDNAGYNLYGAILETRTGKTWQDWLQEVVYGPLGMSRTSSYTSTFGFDQIAWNHAFAGGETLEEVPPKTDGMMQSAGGTVTSTTDMAAFLQMQLRGEAPGLSRAVIAAAQAGAAETGMDDGRNAYELPCSAYSLGWNICEYNGHELHIHGGGYPGSRSMMAWSPDLGIGVATFANSDTGMGWFTSRAINMYLQFLTEDENAARMADLRVSHLPERRARIAQFVAGRDAEDRAREEFGGWDWAPSQAELAAFAGRYSNGEHYSDFTLVQENGGLTLRWGDARMALDPARQDLFAARLSAFDTREALAFQRDASGRVTGVVWEEDLYRRVD